MLFCCGQCIRMLKQQHILRDFFIRGVGSFGIELSAFGTRVLCKGGIV